MSDQQESQINLSNPTSSSIIRSELLTHQSENSSSTTQLLERNTKQIHIKEESTVKKVLKTREVRHINASSQPEHTQVEKNLDARGNGEQNNSGSIRDQVPIHESQLDENSESRDKSNNFSNPTNDFPNNLDAIQNEKPGENYQNLVARNQPNHIIQISSQDNHQQSNQHLMQPVQRTTLMNSGIPPSGYEELDSTMGYPQKPMRSMLHEPQSSEYASKNSILVQPVPTDPNLIVQPELMSQNGVGYINHKSNYDIAYGTATSQQQVSMPVNTGVYSTRVAPESVYAVNRNGPMTYVSQPSIDKSTEVRWRDPELEEVISFLSNADPIIRANSVAYLQHLSFGDDHIKQKTRLLGGIPLLIDLLNRDILEVQRNVCGALRNLSFGKKNDDNKRAIRDALGVQALVRTLINNPDNEIRELATSVLWNLSSCEDIKWSIVDIALNPLVSVILVPYTAWFKANFNNSQQFLPTSSETHWSTVFRNATGVLRNISSAGAHARKQLRDCEGLVESLFFITNTSISRNDVENKLVENCVCILRNLSYRCQETQDPDYDKHYFNDSTHIDSTNSSIQNSPSSPSSSANLTTSLVGQVASRVSDNMGCFSFVKKSKSRSKSSLISARNNLSNRQNDQSAISNENRSTTLLPPHHPSNLHNIESNHTMVRTSTQIEGLDGVTLPPSGFSNISGESNTQRRAKDLLWQPDVVKPYLALLSGCSNPETLEAAAGAIQNLAACYWQPSIEIRAAVRKERGLPVLVELLRMDKDSVVCVVATALRNLAIDQKNKELIGKYAMPDLVNKLTTVNSDQECPSSDDTIAAVLATLHEVISNNVDFVRSFYEAGGLNKLTFMVRNRAKYSVRVQRFAAQVS